MPVILERIILTDWSQHFHCFSPHRLPWLTVCENTIANCPKIPTKLLIANIWARLEPGPNTNIIISATRPRPVQTSRGQVAMHDSLSLPRGSSVSIVSGYGLDDRAIVVRSLAREKDFSCSLCVRTFSGAHPASFRMGSGALSPGQSAAGREADHSPYLVPRSWISRSYI
jgi:hypothetical protein